MAVNTIDFVVKMTNEASSVLRNLGADFQSLGRIANTLKEQLDATAEGFASIDRAATTTVAKWETVSRTMTAVKTASTEMNASLEGSARAMTSLSGALQTSLEARTAGVTRLASAISRLTSSTGGLAGANTEIARLGTSLETLVGATSRIAPQMRAFQTTMRGVSRAIEQTTGAANGMGSGITELDRMSIAMERLAQATTVITPVGRAFSSIRTAANNLGSSVATIDALAVAMDRMALSTGSMLAVPAAFQRLANDIRAETAVIRREIADVNSVFSQGTPAARSYVTALDAVVKHFKDIIALGSATATAINSVNLAMARQTVATAGGGDIGTSMKVASHEAENLGYALEHATRRVSGLHEGIAGIVALMGAGVVVERLMGWSEAMAHVQAITMSTKEQMADWESAARQIGVTTEYSAVQAGNAMESLARAGITGAGALTAIIPVTNLARLSGQSFEDTTKELVQIMGDYAISLDKVSIVTDVLAVTTKHSLATMADMVVSFRYVGATAAEAGISVNETAAALAVLANGGVRASTAGTGLRGMFTALVNPTSKAQQAFEDLGLSMDQMDVQAREVTSPGHGLENIMRDLKAAGAGTKELQEIFGKWSMNAAGIVMAAVGTGKFAEAFERTNHAIGEAAKIGQTYADNLQSDWLRLKAVFTEATIELGDGGMNDAIRGILQGSRAILLIWEGIVTEGDAAYEQYHRIAQVIEDIGVGLAALAVGGLVAKVAEVGLAFFSWPRAIAIAAAALWDVRDNTVEVHGHVISLAGAFEAAAEAATHIHMPENTTWIDLWTTGIVNAAVLVVNKVIGASRAIWDVLLATSTAICNLFEGVVRSIIERFMDLGTVISKLMSGDFAGANEAAGLALGKSITTGIGKAFDSLGDDITKAMNTDYLHDAGVVIANTVIGGVDAALGASGGALTAAEEATRKRQEAARQESEDAFQRRLQQEEDQKAALGASLEGQDATRPSFLSANPRLPRGAGHDDEADDGSKKKDPYADAIKKVAPFIEKQKDLSEAIAKASEKLAMGDAELKKYGITTAQLSEAIQAAEIRVKEETGSYDKHMEKMHQDADMMKLTSDQRRIATDVLNQYNQSLGEGKILTEDQMKAMAAAEANNHLSSQSAEMQRNLDMKSQEIEREEVLMNVRGKNADITRQLLDLEYQAAQKGVTLSDSQLDAYKSQLEQLQSMKKEQSDVTSTTDFLFDHLEKGAVAAASGSRAAFTNMLKSMSEDLMKSSMHDLFDKMKSLANGEALGKGVDAKSQPFKNIADQNANSLKQTDYLSSIMEYTRQMAAATQGQNRVPGDKTAMSNPIVQGGHSGGSLDGSNDQILTVAAAARKAGIDPTVALATVERESSFNSKAGNKNYGGLFGTPRGQNLSPQEQIDAGLKEMQGDRDWFERAHGEVPTGQQQYLMHNQGLLGYQTLTSGDPNQSLKEAYQQAGIPFSNVVGQSTREHPGNLQMDSGLPRDETLTKGQYVDYMGKKTQADMDAAAAKLAAAGDKLTAAADKQQATKSDTGPARSFDSILANPVMPSVIGDNGDISPTPYVDATDQSRTAVAKATGGLIFGPGGPKDDAILARLSNQEYVVNADATGYYGSDILDMINNKTFPKEMLPAFADGGVVGSSVPSSISSGGSPFSGSAAALYGAAIDLSQASEAVNTGGNYLNQGAQLILTGGQTAVQKTWQSAVPYAQWTSSSSFTPKPQQPSAYSAIFSNFAQTAMNKMALAGLNSDAFKGVMSSMGIDTGGTAVSTPGGGVDITNQSGGSGGSSSVASGSGGLFGGLGNWFTSLLRPSSDNGANTLALPALLPTQTASTPNAPGFTSSGFSTDVPIGPTSDMQSSSAMSVDQYTPPQNDVIGQMIQNAGMDSPDFNAATDSLGNMGADASSSMMGSALGAMSSMEAPVIGLALSVARQLIFSQKPTTTTVGSTSVNWTDASGNAIGGYTFDEEKAKTLSQGLIDNSKYTSTNVSQNDNTLNPNMAALTSTSGNLVWNPGSLVKNSDGTIQNDARTAQWMPSFFGQNPYTPIGGSNAYEQGGSLFNYMPYTYHDGGVVGDPTNSSRSVSSSLWGGARRYHDGGEVLSGDEVPIIAKRGERVLNLSDSALLAQSLSAPGSGLLRDDALSPQSLAGGRGGNGVNSNGYSAGNGSGGHTIYLNVSTPDAQSFKKSESQIGHEVGNAINRTMRRNG